MAIAWVFVLAVRVAGSGAATRYVLKDPGEPTPLQVTEFYMGRLRDSSESDSSLSDAMSAHYGYAISVATYTGTFELRRAQMIFSVADGSVGGEDSRVVTMDFAKLASGSIVDSWIAADFTNLADNLDALWTTLKADYTPSYKYDRLKVYRIGPSVNPPQVPVYDAERDVAGTGGAQSLPPQVALTVTEKAGSKRYWGRTYWPAPATARGVNPTTTQSGRWVSAICDRFADALDVFYEAMRADSLEPVVYRRALEQRETAAEKRAAIAAGTFDSSGVGSLAARSASAVTITDIQVDDIPDVIRSRRFKVPTLRVQRLLT